MKYKIASLTAALVLMAGIFAALPVKAQQSGNGFRISPVRVELTIEKGKTEKTVLTIENPTPVDIDGEIVVNDFEAATDETGQPKVIFDTDKSAPGNSFKSLVAPLGKISIPAKTKKDVTVTISVPGNASPGGYYGAVRVAPLNEAEKNVTLAASVGTLFLVKVPGNLTESLNLTELTAAKNGSNGRFFINAGDMTVVTRLQNTGNIHVKPFGTVKITDSKGNTVEEYEFNFNEPRSNVLPNSTRKFEDKLKYDKWFGKYTITANLGYGTGGNLITAKNTFWVIPAWMVILAVAAFIGLIVIAFLIYRKLSSKKKHTIKARR